MTISTAMGLKREPSGRRSRAGQRESAPAQIKRLRDAAMSGVMDARWGSELGRLYLAGKIDGAMFAAGARWSETSAVYYAAIGAPPPSARALSMDRRQRAAPPDPDSTEGALQAASDYRAVKRMLKAHAALVAAGMIAENVVRSVCERDEAAAWWQIDALATGLRALAVHWNLSGGIPAPRARYPRR